VNSSLSLGICLLNKLGGPMLPLCCSLKRSADPDGDSLVSDAGFFDNLDPSRDAMGIDCRRLLCLVVRASVFAGMVRCTWELFPMRRAKGRTSAVADHTGLDRLAPAMSMVLPTAIVSERGALSSCEDGGDDPFLEGE
jgi:hypothetical protein